MTTAADWIGFGVDVAEAVVIGVLSYLYVHERRRTRTETEMLRLRVKTLEDTQ